MKTYYPHAALTLIASAFVLFTDCSQKNEFGEWHQVVKPTQEGCQDLIQLERIESNRDKLSYTFSMLDYPKFGEMPNIEISRNGRLVFRFCKDPIAVAMDSKTIWAVPTIADSGQMVGDQFGRTVSWVLTTLPKSEKQRLQQCGAWEPMWAEVRKRAP